jgi:hypothetical protein
VDAKDVSTSFVVGKAELDTTVDTTGTEEGGVESVGSERRGEVNWGENRRNLLEKTALRERETHRFVAMSTLMFPLASKPSS